MGSFSISVVMNLLVVLFASFAITRIPVQASPRGLRDEYVPIVAEYLNRYVDQRDTPELQQHPNGGLSRQTRRGLDSLSGATFGQNKRFISSPRKAIFDLFQDDGMNRLALDNSVNKKNFDEIDRNAFDGFVKRNIDEIDHLGWGGFLKKPLLLKDYIYSN